MIQWNDPSCPVSEHFTVRDCLWLNTWGRLATELDGLNDQIKNNLISTCELAEKIRTLIGCPMEVTSMYRPPAYSPVVGGTAHDVHTLGIAMDFIPLLDGIEAAKQLIRPQMEALQIRMESKTTTWIHIDSHAVGPSGREFIP